MVKETLTEMETVMERGGQVAAPPSSRTGQLWSHSAGFRIKDRRKGIVQSPSVAKESHCSQACVRGAPAGRPWEAIVWSHEGEARISPETPGCWRYWSCRMPAKEPYRQGVEQEREGCCTQPSWKELEIWTALTWDIEMQSLEFAQLVFNLASIQYFLTVLFPFFPFEKIMYIFCVTEYCTWSGLFFF